MFFFSHKKRAGGEINPEDIFLDTRTLPAFDKNQLEGEIEKPISKSTPLILGVFCTMVIALLAGKAAALQVAGGEAFYDRSINNTLRLETEFAPRGVVVDRNGVELAWNEDRRTYLDKKGFGHLLGYVGYPNEEGLRSGEYEPKELVGIDGVERTFSSILEGKKGTKLVEVDAVGRVETEAVHVSPTSGSKLALTVDSRLQEELHKSLRSFAIERNFKSGAGVIMDIETGELLAVTSYPEYDPNAFVPGSESRDKISEYFNNPQQPFLDRAVYGLYTPGSVVKPFLALAALEEGLISPTKKILSTGELRVPNPYNPDQDSIFRDWKAHGWVDMREAIAVSSDVYFYVVGGGFEDQAGLGIDKIVHYSRLFGLAEKTGSPFPGEPEGVIPTPDWKAEHFDGDSWRLGDTYHTSIGQYGYQITPLQLTRSVAMLANGGILLHPQIVYSGFSQPAIERKIDISEDKFRVVQEGMRLGVTNGTALSLNMPFVKIAAKTGTAEIGLHKEYVNSLVTGYFPYENPRYAFAVVMERGPSNNNVGASAVMKRVFEWMNENVPEYLVSKEIEPFE